MKHRRVRPRRKGGTTRNRARTSPSPTTGLPPGIWPPSSPEEHKRKKQIAAALEHENRPDLALTICSCGPFDPENRIHPCKRPFCCRFCNAVAGYEERRKRAARVLLALEDNPHLALYFVTLTTHDHADFETQVVGIKKRMNRLLRRTSVSRAGLAKGDPRAWSKVRAMIYWIEPSRGASGLWRSHIHAIVAFDERDPPSHPRCLVLEWAHDHRIDLPKPWSGDHWEKDREYRDIVEHQEIKTLHCYPRSALSSRVDATCNPVARLFDVMEVAEYARTDRRSHGPAPGKRHVPLSADDRVHITLLGLRLGGCSGEFFGVDPIARKSLQAQLTEIDRSPSLRRQLYIEALRHSSKAASLIPRPQVNG